MAGVLNMLPGVGKIKKQLEGVDLDNLVLKRQTAIIGSMTPFERRNPKVLNAQRKRRIAAGSGTSVQEVNKLIKMHVQMADMMKKLGRSKGGLMGKMFGGGGTAPDPAELERMQAELAGLDPSALPPELRPPGGNAPKTLPGLGGGGGGLPGLGMPRLPGLGSTPFRGPPPPPGKKQR
jgi:signal recognition particle subunit SRP54